MGLTLIPQCRLYLAFSSLVIRKVSVVDALNGITGSREVAFREICRVRQISSNAVYRASD